MKKWIPLFLTQFLGVLNDNLLKHLIIFIGIFWVSEDHREFILPAASALLVLPYIIFSPLAGYISQVKNKKTVVRIAKFAEIPIMAVAILGFQLESVITLLTALFLMGLQSALYSPSKFGLIKDISNRNPCDLFLYSGPFKRSAKIMYQCQNIPLEFNLFPFIVFYYLE